jgi:DNA invertase Pin-like site-specific DNA recombinase
VDVGDVKYFNTRNGVIWMARNGTLTAEQMEFVQTVKDMWAKGSTQQQIADSLGLHLSTLRNRLRYYGYKFVRPGRIEPVKAPSLEVMA